MNTWSPLWSGIVDSSIWDESDCVCKVFITMLALKDSDHIYRGNAYKLARRARKTEEEVLGALKVLAAPDKRRHEEQQFGGRRIKAVEDGWLILNGEKYRRMVSEEMRKARLRRAQAAFRERQKRKKVGETPREKAFVEAMGNGDLREADRIAAMQSPSQL